MDYEEKIIELASGLKIALQYDEEEDSYTNDIVITDVSGTECVLYIEEISEIYFELQSLGLVV
jgi:hypothetical protein